MAFTMLPIDFIYEHIEDEYGVYETGMFTYKGKDILINKEMGEWHLSVSANHTLGYYELKEIQKAAQIGQWKYSSREKTFYYRGYNGIVCTEEERSINFQDYYETILSEENCFHLYQIKFDK